MTKSNHHFVWSFIVSRTLMYLDIIIKTKRIVLNVHSPGHLWKTGTVWLFAGIFQICLKAEFGSIHIRQEYVSRCAFPSGVGNPATEAWPLIQGPVLSTYPVKIQDFDFVINKNIECRIKKCFVMHYWPGRSSLARWCIINVQIIGWLSLTKLYLDLGKVWHPFGHRILRNV